MQPWGYRALWGALLGRLRVCLRVQRGRVGGYTGGQMCSEIVHLTTRVYFS